LPAVPFRSALRAWVKVAAYSFGGPAGQIAVLHRVVVDERKWLTEDRFIHALSYCMLLPGPEAQQLATYVGWLLHGVRGGLAAGLLFILPGFVSILLLSIAYVAYREMGLVAAVFFGLKPAVAAIVAEAVVRLKRRALKGSLSTWIAAAAFVAIFFFDVPFPLIVIGAAIAGLAGDRFGPRHAAAEPTARVAVPRVGPLIRTVLTWLAIWLAPVAALLLIFGRDHVFVREAAFFSKVALVTFGGAYAVLAYVAQQAVDVFGWLTAGQMLDGLGLAETTPGPLIMVVQFVGFLGAAGSPGTMDPLVAGVVGSVVTTWVTFAPCFLFIFAGAPYVEWLRGHRALTAALGGVMAAVVGVVLNLAVWFALHVVFAEVASTRVGPARLWIPELSSIDVAAALIAAGALVAVLRYRFGMFAVLGAGAAVGVLYKLVLGG
jgi:chromate transporter